MKEIFLPINVNNESAHIFAKDLMKKSLFDEDEIIINLQNFARNKGRIEPFAALLVINVIRSFQRKAKKKNVKVIVRNVKESKIQNIYAKHLRFYSSLGFNIGEKPDKDYTGNSGSNFIPIMRVDASSIKKSVDEYRDVKYIASSIATVASRGEEILYECIEFCIIELLRNILEHSGSNKIWYAVQYWPSRNGGRLVELAVMDEGIGVKSSLEKELDDEDNKLKFALIPGCSSKATTHYIGDNSDNSGFGLYMSSEIGRRNDDFILVSNDESLYLKNTTTTSENCLITGTIIRMRLDIDKLKNYETQKEELIKEGLKTVKK